MIAQRRTIFTICRQSAGEHLIVTWWRSREALERYKATGPTMAPELAHAVEGGSIEEYEVLAEDEYDLF